MTELPGVETVDVPAAPAVRFRSALGRSDLLLYVYAGLLTAAAVTLMMRLWRATMSVPFAYRGDAVASAAYFKDVIQVGWYENQPHLGAPYGQHYHDFPFADDLNPAMAKVIGVFTSDWAVAFNTYYLLGFLLCALSAVWFFRVCGLGRWMTVVLAVLFAVAPYHFIRGESNLFLASYYCVPLAMVVVLRATRGESLWGRRRTMKYLPSIFLGRGAATVLILALVVYSGAYYGLFTAFLLALGSVFALVRRRDWRRLGGSVVAVGAVALFFVLALLPDILYTRTHGADDGALVRRVFDAETYGLKFTSLLLPPPGHPLAVLAAFRKYYDSTYPLPGERAALGLMAALGFLALLSVPVLALTGRFSGEGRDPAGLGRYTTIGSLSFLTYAAFLIGTIGGLGTFVSFFTSSIRGWNRISIIIALFALAGLGLATEAGGRRIDGRVRTRTQSPLDSRTRLWGRSLAAHFVPVIAVVVLVVGVADQSLIGAVPGYADNKASSTSDQAYVDSLQQALPDDAMIFILPWQPFPESARANGLPESDQMKLWLHSDTLRWSGGGIKGRPQSDWPGVVVKKPVAQMVRDLATIGFAGISIHRTALKDAGKKWEAALTPLLGPPTIVSPDGAYSYFSLAKEVERLDASTTGEQRAALAESLTHIAPGT